MKTLKINGLQLEKMLHNALASLRQAEENLNSLNVFPVADGDTGTNMYATLEAALKKAEPTAHAGVYLKALSDAMLLGARGNSGVILSQMFRGISQSLRECESITVADLSAAFVCAYKAAYASVVRPVEGTILTVAREGIEHIRTQIDRGTAMEDLLAMYRGEMRRTLAATPEMLPALKEAGVVDSGALGYIRLIEGMEKYLQGEYLDNRPVDAAPAPNRPVDLSLFHENSTFADGYCLEFILQLMRSTDYSQHFRLGRYINDLKGFGESIVAVQDGTRVKVHIHTMKPARVLALSQEYGEFLTCKLENMQLQHNEHTRRTEAARTHKPFAIVAVADSMRMKHVFTELGCRCAIYGGKKMNVSVQELTDAIRSVNADTVAILPNNPNVILTAEQAKSLCRDCDIQILPTRTVPQGYSALAMDVADSTDVPYRLRQLQKSMDSALTLSVATASRDYSADGMHCPAGSLIGILGSRIVSTGRDAAQVFIEGLRHIDDIDERETCIIFRGAAVSAEQEPQLAMRINAVFPLLEVCFIEGGSELYSLSAAIS